MSVNDIMAWAIGLIVLFYVGMLCRELRKLRDARLEELREARRPRLSRGLPPIHYNCRCAAFPPTAKDPSVPQGDPPPTPFGVSEAELDADIELDPVQALKEKLGVKF